MLLDILIFVPILTCILLGLRDGVVRKLVAIVVMIAGLFLGQIYMHDVGNLIFKSGQEAAPMYGFLIIFIVLVILQSLLYKFLTESYKIGGFADRVGGIVLGFIEGALFVSILLLIFSLSGFPSRDIKRDASFYKPIVNIAPRILDVISTTGPEAIQKVKEIGTPSAIGGESKKDVQQTGNNSTDKK
jgi:uncharacterized membrane protein required for colicin V production